MDRSTYQLAAQLAEADGQYAVAAQLRAQAAQSGLGGLGAEWSTWAESDAADLFDELSDYYCQVYKRPLPQRVYDAAVRRYDRRAESLDTRAKLIEYVRESPPEPGDLPARYGGYTALCSPNAIPGDPSGETVPRPQIPSPPATIDEPQDPRLTLPTEQDVAPIAIGAGIAAVLLLLMRKRKPGA